VVARIVFDEKRSVWLLRLEKRELKNEEIEEIMPAEIVTMTATEVYHRQEEAVQEINEALAQATEFKHIVDDIAEAADQLEQENDEFDLQPEESLGPSPDGAPRVRRL
jgi:hypothetical protein